VENLTFDIRDGQLGFLLLRSLEHWQVPAENDEVQFIKRDEQGSRESREREREKQFGIEHHLPNELEGRHFPSDLIWNVSDCHVHRVEGIRPSIQRLSFVGIQNNGNDDGSFRNFILQVTDEGKISPVEEKKMKTLIERRPVFFPPQPIFQRSIDNFVLAVHPTCV